MRASCPCGAAVITGSGRRKPLLESWVYSDLNKIFSDVHVFSAAKVTLSPKEQRVEAQGLTENKDKNVSYTTKWTRVT